MNLSQLRRKSRKQLLVLVKAAGVPATGSSTKAKLIQAILAASAGQPSPAEEETLPAGYGCTRLVLMDVGPRLVYAYWEVTPADFRDAMMRLVPLETPAPWVLRFYDVTCVAYDGTNAHGYFDIPVDLAPGNWYVRLWEGEKSYFAEIGPRAPDGRLWPVCRSNFVRVPRDRPSPCPGTQWLKVEEKFGGDEPTVEQAREPGAEEGESSPAPVPLPSRNEEERTEAGTAPVVPYESDAPEPAPSEAPSASEPQVLNGACIYGPGGSPVVPPERTTVAERESFCAPGTLMGKGND